MFVISEIQLILSLFGGEYSKQNLQKCLPIPYSGRKCFIKLKNKT